MNEIGLRLKTERLRLRMSQRAFGEVGGVLGNAQANYERGERSPTAYYLVRLIKIGVDISYILTGTRSIFFHADDDVDALQFNANFAKLTKNQRKIISDLVESMT